MANLFVPRNFFAINLLRGNDRKNIYLYFVSLETPELGFDSRLLSQHSSYQTTVISKYANRK